MPFCDFKISRIVEGTGAVKVLARFYEGADVTFTRPNMRTGLDETVTEYQRSAVAGERTFTFPARTTRRQIEKALAARLADYSTREPIPAQRTTRARPA